MRKIFALYLTTFFIFISLSFLGGCASNSGSEGDNGNDDGNTDPSIVLPTQDPSINIYINQVETECLGSGNTHVSAHISVVDESGNPVEDLTLGNFQVTENSSSLSPGSISFFYNREAVPEPISVAIIMDYSTSIMNLPDYREAMEKAVVRFIDMMKPTDQVEIIKFNTGIRYVQPFTSDKNVLKAAVATEVLPGATYLYDTLYTAIEDVATQTGRKAVVALSDGGESHNGDFPGDGRTIEDVITLAQGDNVPLFIVGLVTDENYEQWLDEIQRMTEETSGQYYQTATGSELTDIYSKISNIINESQYLIEFESTADGAGNTLNISVDHNGLSDNADTTFTACP